MEPEKKSNGAFIGLIVIIIILVVGGIYIWVSNKNATEKMKETQAQLKTVTSQDSAALDALEQDLKTTNTDIGVDVNAVN
ncbi:MAG: hypothetical protein AAB902_00330 [Patescibacteria group bacterium]